MNDSNALWNLLLGIPAFVAGLTLHEFAHAWTADKLGDDTPRRLGRLTLDPMAHLDAFGSLMFVISSLSGFGFGWAKPVPFNMRNLGHPRRDAMLIAVAGPISNLLQVPIWLAALWLLRVTTEKSDPAVGIKTLTALATRAPDLSSLPSVIGVMLALGVIVNILLAAFNMIPIPPLDGHYILEGLGPPVIGDLFNMIRPWSFLILLLALSLPGNPLGQAIRPAINAAFSAVSIALGLGPLGSLY